MARHRRRFALAAVLAAVLFVVIAQGAVASESVLIYTVLDEETGRPVPDANVVVMFADNGSILAETTTDSSGVFEVVIDTNARYTVHIVAEGFENLSRNITIDNLTYQPMEFRFTSRLTPAGYDPDPHVPDGTFWGGPARYVILVTIVALASTVMYSKIRRDSLLNHAVRRRIYDHVKENPGAHYRAILESLDLTMGVLTYHLNRLEKGEYLRSRQDGMYRRFFIAGRKTEVRFFLTDVQESILGVIRENQGISQSRIAERINVSRKVVNYHIRILDQAGLVSVETRGRETACYVHGTA
jgi:DNA-binding MarR family transcriptional regulator